LCPPAGRPKLPPPHRDHPRGSRHGHGAVRRQSLDRARAGAGVQSLVQHRACPQVLRFQGAVSARRYKAILGEDRHQYMAVYEFESEATLRRFLDSEHFAHLKRDYDASFGDVSERARSAYVQVWP
jgi:hypothetical protein